MFAAVRDLLSAAHDQKGQACCTSDMDLLAAHRACMAAEAAMAATSDPDLRDKILTDQWAPAYEAVCTLPARTLPGLLVKLLVVLAEHEDGASPWSVDLRQTTRAALRLLD